MSNYNEQLGALLSELDSTGLPFTISSCVEYDEDSCEQCGHMNVSKAPGYDVVTEGGGCFGGANSEGATLVEALQNILEALKE